MTPKRLSAMLLATGLALAGSSRNASANGFCHFPYAHQSSFSFSSPATTSQAFALAAPAVTTQAFMVTAPSTSVQAFTLGAPPTAAQAFTLPTQVSSQPAVFYTVVPTVASNQAQDAVAQFGVTDIFNIIDLLNKIRGGGGRAGSGGILNPGGGLDVGNRPIEVKVTLCDDSTSPSLKGGQTSATENKELVKRLIELGVLKAASQATAPAAPFTVSPSGQAPSRDDQLEAITSQLRDINVKLENLNKDVEVLKKGR